MRITLLSFVVLACMAATQAAAQSIPSGSRAPLRPYRGDEAPLVQVGVSWGVYGLPKPTRRPTCEQYHVPCAEPGDEQPSAAFGGTGFVTVRVRQRFGVMAQVTTYGTASEFTETTIVAAGPLWTTVTHDRDGKTASGMPFVSVLVGRGSAAFGASGPVLQATAGLDLFASETGAYPALGTGLEVGCRVGAGGARHFTGCALTLRASLGIGLR